MLIIILAQVKSTRVFGGMQGCAQKTVEDQESLLHYYANGFGLFGCLILAIIVLHPNAPWWKQPENVPVIVPLVQTLRQDLSPSHDTIAAQSTQALQKAVVQISESSSDVPTIKPKQKLCINVERGDMSATVQARASTSTRQREQQQDPDLFLSTSVPASPPKPHPGRIVKRKLRVDLVGSEVRVSPLPK